MEMVRWFSRGLIIGLSLIHSDRVSAGIENEWREPRLIVNAVSLEKLRTAEAVRQWLQDYALAIRRGVTKYRPETEDEELLLQYASIRWNEERPVQYEQKFEGSPKKPGRFVVNIPVVRKGQEWVAPYGHVIIGYTRLVRVWREDIKRTVGSVDGKRMVRIDEHSNSATHQRHLGVKERVRQDDEPILSPTIQLLVSRTGKIYY